MIDTICRSFLVIVGCLAIGIMPSHNVDQMSIWSGPTRTVYPSLNVDHAYVQVLKATQKPGPGISGQLLYVVKAKLRPGYSSSSLGLELYSVKYDE